MKADLIYDMGQGVPSISDMVEGGWKVDADNEENPPKIAIGELELVPCLRQGEYVIGGLVLVERAKELNIRFGQRFAKYLWEHRQDFPKRWSSHILVLAGTVLRDCDGDRRIPGFRHEDGRWAFHLYVSGYGFDGRVRLLRPRAWLFEDFRP
ncbi:MAG: hypothetical protein HYT49_02490 [Candidatus Wildermuthbacteria bacterium]|nr:hypothetical protein [Candidatus Wildermuthbacteria bacterium]